MLRPSFARKVVRLRATRAIHSTVLNLAQSTTVAEPAVEPVATEVEAADAPPASVPSDLPDPSNFPLYRSPPAPKAGPPPKPEKIDLDRLPTEEEIDIAIKEQITADAIKHVPEYTEENLREFYKSVVLSGAAEQAQEILPQIAAPEQRTTVNERRLRLGELSRRLLEPRDGEELPLVPALQTDVPKHMALTAALIKIAPETRGQLTVPIGLVTQSEWRALFDSFLARSDVMGAEVLLSTMERHGVVPTTDDLNEVIEEYAKKGQTAEVARLIQDFEAVGLPLTDFHRDMVIKSAMGPEGNTENALALLTQAEEMAQPFPQSSYNIVLERLVDGTSTELPDPRTRAQALDLFANMRFAAHPTPTRELYTTMIRLCGAPQDPQPERARDLWLEMIEEHEMQPTANEYNAIIRALGSTKADYLEAYDLLRQMLSMHEEATSVPFEGNANKLSPWVPTLETFSALLEGTKRAGDLDRARWVLNEMVDLARAGSFSGHPGLQGPDEEMMSHIFQTYAAWRPRVKRGDVKPKAVSEAEPEATDAAKSSDVVEAEEQDAESPGGPSSRADALREATALFEAILAASTPSAAANPFRGVKVTTRLVNSYLSVHLNHSSLETARQVFKDTWVACETTAPTPGQTVLPNGFTYLGVLERCARGMRKADRALAQEWGREAWAAWRKWSDLADAALPAANPQNRRKRFLLGLGERQIEKVWVAVIRLLAIGDDVSGSLALFNEFVATYPPENVRGTYAPYVPPQFAIRMTTPDMIGEPGVPPHLLFRDVDVLHNRFVRDENWDGVRRLKWACLAYERSLATRRKWRQRGVGVAREVRSQAREKGLPVPRIERRKSHRLPILPSEKSVGEKREGKREWRNVKGKPRREKSKWDHSRERERAGQ